MNTLHLLVQRAVAAGLLPVGAQPPGQDARPWPVVLLTALGAWLAAVPLLGVVGLLVGDWVSRGPGLYVVGLGLLAGALAVLRRPGTPLFVEQLAVPALLVGGGSWAMALARDLPERAALLVLAVVAIGLALLVTRAWLRVLLGALAASLLVLALVPRRPEVLMINATAWFWLAWHGALAVWALAWHALGRVLAGPPQRRSAAWAAALDALAAGWLLAVLAGLAWWSGMTFLAGASLGGGFIGAVAHDLAMRSRPVEFWLMGLASAAAAAAGAGWLAWRWPALRRAWFAGVGLAAAALAGLLPALGGVLAALALCATERRWRLAGAAALAGAWIIGSFYYGLQLPLATKSLALVAAGAVLAVLALWARRDGAGAPAGAPAVSQAVPAAARAGLLATALLVAAVVNLAIWQKEDLIARGQPVFVELAPVDPRSLMQGDYMLLAFRLPGEAMEQLEGVLSAERPRLVGRRDARGVVTLLRRDDGAALGSDELRIELTPKGGRWVLVTDAWFFKEGEAERWAAARYGEFRVTPDGRALLVGLRGAELRVLD